MPFSKKVVGEAHHNLPRGLLAFKQYNPQIEIFFKKKNWLFLLPKRLVSKLQIRGGEGAGLRTFSGFIPHHVLLFPAVSAKT